MTYFMNLDSQNLDWIGLNFYFETKPIICYYKVVSGRSLLLCINKAILPLVRINFMDINFARNASKNPTLSDRLCTSAARFLRANPAR